VAQRTSAWEYERNAWYLRSIVSGSAAFRKIRSGRLASDYPLSEHVATYGKKAVLLARFERIFTLETGFVTLDRLLVRLRKKKSELLLVLDRPEIPLHNDDAIADLICDLGHLADEWGLDFLNELRRGIGHWYAERYARECDALGPNASVEVAVKPRMVEF
jgi:hypothetical protein